MSGDEKTAETKVSMDNSKSRKDRKIVSEGAKGVVKWFNCRQGYGFIQWDTGKEDIFVHRTAIPFSKSNKLHASRTLDEGEEIIFDVREGRDGKVEAWNISGPDGARLKGSRYALTKKELAAKYRRPRRSSEKEERKSKDEKSKTQDDKTKTRDETKSEEGKGDGEGGKENGKRNRHRRKPKAKVSSGEGDAKDKSEAEEEGKKAGKTVESEQTKKPKNRRSEGKKGKENDQNEQVGEKTSEDKVSSPVKGMTVKERIHQMIAKVHGTNASGDV